MRRVAICALLCGFAAAQAPCAQRAAKPAASPDPVRYRIGGVIVDATTETPIVGAELSITTAEVEMRVTSDEEGHFVFEGLEAGKYAVTASAPGYVTESYNEHRGYSTAIAVGEGLDSEHMLFRLHRQAVITGTVTDERGEAVRNAQVLLFVEERAAGKQSVRMAGTKQTDDLGVYRFAHLRAGKYFVAVSARPWYAQTGIRDWAEPEPDTVEGGSLAAVSRLVPLKTDAQLDVVYPATLYPGVTDEHSAGELVLNPGDTQEADVRLHAVPSIHMRVTNLPPEQPRQPSIYFGATQKVFSFGGSGVPVTTGQVAPGVYEVAGLPPGDVTLTLHDNRSGQHEMRTIHANATDGESIDARGTGATASVSGKVLGTDVAGAKMQGQVALAGKRGQEYSSRLEKDGTFSFPAVDADTYEVEVHMGADEYVREVSATGAKASAEEVTIEGTDEVQLVIRMARGHGEVKGVVKVHDKPQAGAMVLLVPASGTVSGEALERHARMDQSDSDGTFTLARIFPGKYVLMAIEDGWDLDWRDPEVLRPYREKGQPVEIAAGDVKKLTVEQQKHQELQNSEAKN